MECGVETLWREWKTVRMLGEGSFGKVYEIARSRFGVEERSAVKIMSIPASMTEVQSLHNDGMTEDNITAYYRGVVSEFVQEIALMSKLRGHANVVGYEDYEVVEREDRFGWDIYIRMELLTSLPTYMQKKGRFTPDDVVDMAIDLCTALETCYERRIVHRDIKPDNIFVSEDGVYKLGDFGVAKTVEKTISGLSKKGTYTYMAPEIYKGEPGGLNSDLYSLGIVMYKLLNDNREPFLPPFPEEVTYEHKQQALVRRMNGDELPPPKYGDAALHAIVQKACACHATARWQTPSEMKSALKVLKNPPKVEPPKKEELDKTVAVQRTMPAEKPKAQEETVSVVKEDTKATADEQQPMTASAAGVSIKTQRYLSRHCVGLAVLHGLSLLLCFLPLSRTSTGETVSVFALLNWFAPINTAYIYAMAAFLSIACLLVAAIAARGNGLKISYLLAGDLAIAIQVVRPIFAMSKPDIGFSAIGVYFVLLGIVGAVWNIWIDRQIKHIKKENQSAIAAQENGKAAPKKSRKVITVIAVVLAAVLLTVFLTHMYNTSWRDSLNDTEVAVGDVITFGKFEQDGHTFNGKEDIEWIVVNINQSGSDSQEMTLISKYALKRADIDTYASVEAQQHWASLNFTDVAFSEREMERVSSCGLPVKGIVEDDLDKSFHICEATAYAKEGSLLGKNAKYVAWYLRDETVDFDAYFITQPHVMLADGSIHYNDDIVGIAATTGTTDFYIRPMITITV